MGETRMASCEVWTVFGCVNTCLLSLTLRYVNARGAHPLGYVQYLIEALCPLPRQMVYIYMCARYKV
jgi:hypothetical protein